MSGFNSRFATAFANEEVDCYSLWDQIDTVTDVSHWSGASFALGEGDLSDFPACDTIGRLCSEKLVEVCDSFRSDTLWLPVELVKGDKVLRYFLMHFACYPSAMDVLDMEKTSFLDGDFVDPHVSIAKSADRPFICLRRLSPSLIVRGDVREAIADSGCRGIGFERISSS